MMKMIRATFTMLDDEREEIVLLPEALLAIEFTL